MQRMFSGYNEMRLEINDRKKTWGIHKYVEVSRLLSNG